MDASILPMHLPYIEDCTEAQIGNLSKIVLIDYYWWH